MAQRKLPLSMQPICKEPSAAVEKKFLPFVDYAGSIEYCTTPENVAHSSQMLLKWIDRQGADAKVPIALYLEWSFNLKTRTGRIALMQLCAEPDRCILYQLSCLELLPKELLQLLCHERVTFLGVNIEDDLRMLARKFPELASVDSIIERCIDLNQFYKKLHPRSDVWGLQHLAQQVLKQRVANVWTLTWDVLPLSENQKRDAAIDVYVAVLLYQELLNEQRTKDEQENTSV